MKSHFASQPSVSVVIPAFGRPEMLMRAVRSVLGQRTSDFELIVVDDGSPVCLGDVREVVEQSRHRWLRTAHRGVAAARNAGVELARGEWVAFLDSDDEWLPEKLVQQRRFHNLHPEILLSQTEERWVRRGKRVNRRQIHQLAQGDAFRLCLKRCAISPSSVMISRKLLIANAGFDEEFPVCEDYELWLRLSHQHAIGLVDQPLIVKYGGHADQLTRSWQALDAYRLWAIVKFASCQVLSREQVSEVEKEASQKFAVLLKGSQKRESILLQDLLAMRAILFPETSTLASGEQSFRARCRAALPILKEICALLSREGRTVVRERIKGNVRPAALREVYSIR